MALAAGEQELEAMAIRNATPEDAAGIAEVHLAFWQAAYRGLLPEAMLHQLSVARRPLILLSRLFRWALCHKQNERETAGYRHVSAALKMSDQQNKAIVRRFYCAVRSDQRRVLDRSVPGDRRLAKRTIG